MREKIFALSLLIIFTLIFEISAVSADLNGSPALSKALDNVKCRNDFTIGFINYIVSNFSASSLSSYSTTLQNDYNQLQTYENNNDTSSFRSYLKNTYDPDLTAAAKAVAAWVKTDYKNLTAGRKADIKTTHSQFKTTFDSCHLSTLRNLADNRINQFNNELNAYQNRINALAAKGVNVTLLNQIIQDANTQIIQPMQNALNATNDSTDITNIVKGYCMFDGCDSGINFHLAAKYEIAKLNIALSTIQSNPNATQVSGNITQLQNYITAANNVLTNVGTSKYTSSQSSQIWNNIKSAYKTIQDIIKTLKGSNQ